MFRLVRTWLVGALVVLCAVPALAAPEKVAIRTSDGLTLAGDLYVTGNKGAPAVVALHGEGLDRSEWESIGPEFAERDITLLAIDLRGHGESGLPEGTAEAENSGFPRLIFLSR